MSRFLAAGSELAGAPVGLEGQGTWERTAVPAAFLRSDCVDTCVLLRDSVCSGGFLSLCLSLGLQRATVQPESGTGTTTVSEAVCEGPASG